MNAARVIAGIAVLVLSAFWAVVLLSFLGTIGLMVVLIAPYVTLLAIGSYSIFGGLGLDSGRSRGESARGSGRVGTLALMVLKMISQGKSHDEIAAATSVSPAVIEQKVKTLEKAGFLSDGALSEKGFEVVKDSS